MNKERRKKLTMLLKNITEIQDRLVDVIQEEEEAYSGLHESQQDSTRGHAMEEALEKMNEAHSLLDDAGGALLSLVDDA